MTTHCIHSGSKWLAMPIMLLLWLSTNPASAGFTLGEPILGGRMLVAEDGYVTASFLGSDAGYFNSLYLESPGAGDWFLFDKRSSVGGDPLSLGWYAGGTELIFRLDVHDTGLSFYTGDADRNADGLAHVSAITLLEDDLFVTTVGFEDLWGGGDLDYNDFRFRLTNVIDPLGVPAPPVVMLVLVGLAGIGALRRANNDG